ncbi:MAG: helix-turn-helix domain-containing protein [Thermoplasmata archaeon]
MRQAPRITLSPEEKILLERKSNARGPTRLLGIRARIVLRAAQGRSNLDIAHELGISRLTVARWRQRFRVYRLRGLEDPAPRRPRAGGLSGEKIRAILRATTVRPPPGARPWSSRSLGKAYGVSHATIHRLWRAHGVRPVRYEARPLRPDPRGPLDPIDILGLSLRPEGYAVAFAMGPPYEGPATHRMETGQIPPFDRAAIATDAELARLIDLVPPLPPSDSGGESPKSSPFLNFLETLDRRAPRGMEISVATTAVPNRLSSMWTQWSLRHPRVNVESLPNGNDWQRRVTSRLRTLGRNSPRTKRLGGTAELVRSLERFVGAYTSGADAFEWIANSREIARGRGAHRLRYDLSVTGHAGFKSLSAAPPTMSPPTAPDPRGRAMARAVLRRYLRVRPGERVTIETWSSTLNFANDFVLESLRLGAVPLVLYQDEPTYWAATTEVASAQLAKLGDHRRAALERTDALVSFFGPSDRERFHALPRAVAFKLDDYRDASYHAVAKRGARAVEMAIGRVSPASARMYAVDIDAWLKELIEATLVEPQSLRARGRHLANRLATGRDLSITHPNGTDLRLRLRGYPPEVADGIASRARPGHAMELTTIPAGVVTVAVDERFGEGRFRSNVANSVGVSSSVGELVGGCWTFRKGRIQRWSYDEGRELFDQSYARAGLGRGQPGAISIGLNPRISVAPLLKDQQRGVVTFQIGRNDHLGGSNHATWWAWLLLSGATVSVDGTEILRDGKLV